MVDYRPLIVALLAFIAAALVYREWRSAAAAAPTIRRQRRAISARRGHVEDSAEARREKGSERSPLSASVTNIDALSSSSGGSSGGGGGGGGGAFQQAPQAPRGDAACVRETLTHLPNTYDPAIHCPHKVPVAYVPIPKVASSAFKLWLSNVDDLEWKGILESNFTYCAVRGADTPTIGFDRKACRPRLLAMVVRNPFARLLSCFEEKVLNHLNRNSFFGRPKLWLGADFVRQQRQGGGGSSAAAVEGAAAAVGAAAAARGGELPPLEFEGVYPVMWNDTAREWQMHRKYARQAYKAERNGERRAAKAANKAGSAAAADAAAAAAAAPDIASYAHLMVPWTATLQRAFRHFALALLDTRDEEVDAHARPQAWFMDRVVSLTPGAADSEALMQHSGTRVAILHLETMEADMEAMRTQLCQSYNACAADVPALLQPLSHHNALAGKQYIFNVSAEKAFLDPVLRLATVVRFQRDFDLFGYRTQRVTPLAPGTDLRLQHDEKLPNRPRIILVGLRLKKELEEMREMYGKGIYDKK